MCDVGLQSGNSPQLRSLVPISEVWIIMALSRNFVFNTIAFNSLRFQIFSDIVHRRHSGQIQITIKSIFATITCNTFIMDQFNYHMRHVYILENESY